MLHEPRRAAHARGELMAGSVHQPLPPLRLVLDTNVVVAGLLWNGPPRRLLQAAIDGECDLFSSAVPLDELAHTLGGIASIYGPSAPRRASPSSPRVRSSIGLRREGTLDPRASTANHQHRSASMRL